MSGWSSGCLERGGEERKGPESTRDCKPVGGPPTARIKGAPNECHCDSCIEQTNNESTVHHEVVNQLNVKKQRANFVQ